MMTWVRSSSLWPRTKRNNQPSFAPAQANVREGLHQSMLEYVEKDTTMRLMHPQRPGGPLPEDEAKRLAGVEKQRHEAMLPLRDFVMDHYRPMTIPEVPSMVLYRRVAGGGNN